MCEKPEDIKFSKVATGSLFFKQADKIITYHINGRIRYYSNRNGSKITRIISFRPFKTSVRSLVLNYDDTAFFAGSRLGEISKVDVETSQTVLSYTNKHFDLAAILYIDEKILISASNDGIIKIFDPKISKSVKEIKDLGMYSHMAGDQNVKNLFYCSHDGFLKVFSTKNWKLLDTSDAQDDEYNCSTFLDSGKVLFGSSKSNGRFCVFNKNEWGNPSDIIYTGTKSIEHLIKINDFRVVFASSDGFLGEYRLFPSYVGGYYHKEFPYILTSLSISSNLELIMASSEYGLNFWCTKEDLLKSDFKKSSKNLRNENIGDRIKNTNFFKDI